ncbi:helix-turn-helix domain-containing protein [Gordonia McavH-238-E]|uniref:PucR family transcriptional regulator n=1 Tax=Gordonia sp. McavH-238-E TaxID=2917736 RepID=UPI001EF65D9B|nr:helix-turn-helix domain-containing protein [Gordonia sp. McavH-238-E]MCG7631607.1 helix-turn-helix domain-containing protein [Gordonia sp. McavH-238-E]
MATVGDVVIGVGLLSVTPGAAGRTRHVEVSGTCEAGRIEPADVGAGDIVHMGSTGWPAAGAPEVFAATLRQRAAAAVVVDTDDDNLSAEFVSACVSHGVPIYMLPRTKTFRDVEVVVTPHAVVDDTVGESGPVASILASLGAFHRASGISGAVLLDGAVLTASSATVDTDLLRKTTALTPAVLHAIGGTAAALHITLPRSGAALVLSNPRRRPFESTRVRKLANDIDADAHLLRVNRAMRRPLEGGLVRELIEARIPSSAMDSWVGSFGYGPGDRVHSVAVVIGPHSDTSSARVVDALHDLGACAGLATVAAAHDSVAYALIKTGTEKDPVPPAGRDFDAHLQVFTDVFVARHAELAVGGSSYVIRSSDDLTRGLINARQMAERNSRADDESPATIALPVPLAATLLAGDPERSAELRRSLLDPVLAYDREKDTSYVSTLSTFFALDCHSGATANELGIHINTLRYRLSRIEKLTGRGLQSMVDRTDYYLALCVGETSRGRGDRSRRPTP